MRPRGNVDTGRDVQKKAGKRKRRYRPRVTNAQKKLINAQSIMGVLSQRQIAEEVGLPAVTVGNIQRSLGLAPRSGRMPLPLALENKIIKMRRKYGSPTIAKKLGLPKWRVEQVFVERRFLQEP